MVESDDALMPGILCGRSYSRLGLVLSRMAKSMEVGSVIVDFGAGEKLGESGECGGEVEGSSGWAEAIVMKGSA